MNLITRGALLCTLALPAACGDSISPNEREFGVISATIDGAPFSAALSTAPQKLGVVNPRVVIIASLGSNPTRQLNLVINGVTGVGTIPVSAATGTHVVYSETTGATFLAWTSALPGGSGTVTITETSEGKFVGTFTDIVLVAAPGGATGTKTIVNGTFNINLLFD